MNDLKAINSKSFIYIFFFSIEISILRKTIVSNKGLKRIIYLEKKKHMKTLDFPFTIWSFKTQRISFQSHISYWGKGYKNLGKINV